MLLAGRPTSAGADSEWIWQPGRRQILAARTEARQPLVWGENRANQINRSARIFFLLHFIVGRFLRGNSD